MLTINLQSPNIQFVKGNCSLSQRKLNTDRDRSVSSPQTTSSFGTNIFFKSREPTIQMTETGASTRPPYNVWNPISQPHIASGSQVVADRYLPEGGIIKLCTIEA